MFAGLLAVLPVALTIIIILWLFKYFSKPGVKLIEFIFRNHHIYKYLPPIMGFIFTLLFIYLLGVIIRKTLGRQLLNIVDNIFAKIPIINIIFTTIKQITASVANPNSKSFQKVVIVEYPCKNIWTIMMVTGESANSQGVEFYHVFVPTTPNPTSGFMLFVRKTDVIETDISIEKGLKMVISGGLLSSPLNYIEIELPKTKPAKDDDGE